MQTLPYPLWSSGPAPTLVASRNRQTGELVFPAVAANSPLVDGYETVPVAGVGTVYSYTVIHPSLKSGLQPYALGYVDFPGPVRIFGRLQGNERPGIGDPYVAHPDETLGYVFEAVNA